MPASNQRDEEYVLDLSKLSFYKKYFGKLLNALLVSCVLNIGFLAAFVVTKNQKVEREYFGMDFKTGRQMPMVPLGNPYVSQQKLLDFTVECVGQANTFDFANTTTQLQRNSRCFTPDGWSTFMEALDKSGNVELVKKQKLVTTAVPIAAPVITRQGNKKGIYTWEIEVPFLVSYQGGQSGRTVATQKMLVTLLISRVSNYESEDGLGIAQYIGSDL
ncbi:type IV secretion protein IcmL [Pseudomonas sp. WS 5532]|uniref:DotI/IcmL/TraM family protein n=1 Tax=Pseudomonas sp. WS 5532 TaxID=2717495 RepID=UPI0014735E9E|nr:DotI/IcmL/TraM family protein [Pseudomonas sp. WS 5532]NMX77613.1 type IV secretion protein IcmL [Pseudomonas sp. WS 5532]